MNHSELLTQMIDRFTPRARMQIGPLQRWLALAAWLLALALAVALNGGITLSGGNGVLYFVLLHAIAALLAVRLPQGVYVGLVQTTLIAGALVLGYGPAMLVPLLTSVLVIPLVFVLASAIRTMQTQWLIILYETLWYSGTGALALLPTGWLYERLGGMQYPGQVTPGAYGLALAFVALFFVLNSASTLLWLALSRARLADFWQGPAQIITAGGLLLPAVFAPLIAARYSFPGATAVLEIIPYGLGALLLYYILQAQITLSDRVADLRTLNSISQKLNASLELDDLLAMIYLEISRLLEASSFYLALHDEPSNTLNFVLEYEDGQPLEPASRPFANGLTEYMIRTGQPLLFTRNVYQEARKLGIEPFGARSRSFMGVPVRASERVIGAMALRSYTHEYAYDTNDLRLMETVAAAAGIALENAWLYQRSLSQSRQLTSLNEVSALVSASLELDETIERLCQTVVEVMKCQKSAVFLLDEDTGILRMVGSVGLSETYRAAARRIDPQQAPRALVMRTGRAVAVEDIHTDPRFVPPWPSEIEAEGFRAVLDVPMRIGERTIGSLSAYWNEPRHFEPGEIELMDTLSGQVAIAVENARLFRDTRARHRELEALYETGRAVNASLSVSNVLHAVATSMLRVLEMETCAALLVGEDSDNLEMALWLDADGEEIMPYGQAEVFSLEDQPRLSRAIRERDLLVLQRADAHQGPGKLRLLEYFGLESGIGLPLVMHGEVIGLIVVGMRTRARQFDRETLQLANALANQAAAAIENARLFERTDVALARRLEELAALEELAQRMTRRLDLRAVIEQVVEAAVLATQGEMAEIALLDPTGKTLNMLARRGLTPSEPVETSWPADRGLSGRALSTGEAVYSADVTVDPDYLPARREVRSELVAPIILDGRRLGVINLESTRLNAFRPEHSSFVTSLAEHAAIAIENARLFEAVQQRANEFQTLRAIAVELLSMRNLRHLLQMIAREALKRTHARDIHIYLYDQATGELTFGTSLWEDGAIDREFAPPRPHGLTATVARSGERLAILSPEDHPLFADQAAQPGWESIEAVIGVPLKQADEVIGVFNIAFDRRADVTDDTLHFLDLLAAQAASAIANARLSEEIRTSRDRLQAILDSAADGIVMFDIDGRLALANPRAEELLGMRFSDYQGKPWTWVAHSLSKQFAGEKSFPLSETLAMVRELQHNPHETTRRRHTFSKPTPRVIDEFSLPVIGGDSQIMGRLIILRDVTQEVELESYRQELSYMIVHDLRSPLAGVITGLSIASEEADLLPDDAHRATLRATLRVSLESANSLLRLVEEILDVNKLEAGEVPLIFAPLDLRELAAEAVETLSRTADEAGIEVRVSAPEDLPPVPADHDKIRRVLINLLDNALHYTPDGGQIRIDITPCEDYQELVVTDTGEGIAEELRERIFERFVQGNVLARKRGPKGSGLGLTFCRLAVEAHGGRIWADAGPEGGAAIHVVLPTAR